MVLGPGLLRIECVGVDICAVDFDIHIFSLADERSTDTQVRKFEDVVIKCDVMRTAVTVRQSNALAVGKRPVVVYPLPVIEPSLDPEAPYCEADSVTFCDLNKASDWVPPVYDYVTSFGDSELQTTADCFAFELLPPSTGLTVTKILNFDSAGVVTTNTLPESGISSSNCWMESPVTAAPGAKMAGVVDTNLVLDVRGLPSIEGLTVLEAFGDEAALTALDPICDVPSPNKMKIC